VENNTSTKYLVVPWFKLATWPTQRTNIAQPQPAQCQPLEDKVVGIESTLNIMNETMKSQGLIEIVRFPLESKYTNPNIDPTKEEF
jgi:hypothetical protein